LCHTYDRWQPTLTVGQILWPICFWCYLQRRKLRSSADSGFCVVRASSACDVSPATRTPVRTTSTLNCVQIDINETNQIETNWNDLTWTELNPQLWDRISSIYIRRCNILIAKNWGGEKLTMAPGAQTRGWGPEKEMDFCGWGRLGHENPENAAAGINFVRFTAQISNAINWQGEGKSDFWHIVSMAPLAPQSAYLFIYLTFRFYDSLIGRITPLILRMSVCPFFLSLGTRNYQKLIIITKSNLHCVLNNSFAMFDCNLKTNYQFLFFCLRIFRTKLAIKWSFNFSPCATSASTLPEENWTFVFQVTVDNVENVLETQHTLVAITFDAYDNECQLYRKLLRRAYC